MYTTKSSLYLIISLVLLFFLLLISALFIHELLLQILLLVGLFVILVFNAQTLIIFKKYLHKESTSENKEAFHVLSPVLQPLATDDQEKLRYEAILAYIGEGLVVIDKSGKIIAFNKAAQALLGWTKEEALGQNLVDIFTIDYQHSIEESKHSTSRKSTLYVMRKDKTKFPASITTTSYGDESKILGTITLFRDVTAEQNSDKMKNEFISLASHQLRTPLSAIKWYTNMLLTGDAGKLLPEQKEYADSVYISTERMIALVNSLLNITRIESGRIIVDPKPTDLKQLIEELVKEVKIRYADKNQQISLSVQHEIPLLSLDPQLMRQVFLNLLTNAAKYTPEKGEITISISKNDTDVITEIKDNGYGIPAQEHDKVFDKFYRGVNTVNRGNTGTGLGLYLVKDIVELSQGKITFESQEGKGTTFWILLPLSGMQPKKGVLTLET